MSGHPTSVGGGIHTRGQITIENATISGNSADVQGGGVFVHPVSGFPSLGELDLTTVTVSGNTALVGAGLALYGPATLTASTIASNTTTGGTAGDGLGGGIYYGRPGALEIVGGTIGGDGAANVSQYGGGIAQGGGALTIRDNIIIRANEAEEGGGITAWAGTLIVQDGVDIRGNTAIFAGGGLWITFGVDDGGAVASTSTAAISASTVRENEAAAGGALSLQRSSLTVTDVTIRSSRSSATESSLAPGQTSTAIPSPTYAHQPHRSALGRSRPSGTRLTRAGSSAPGQAPAALAAPSSSPSMMARRLKSPAPPPLPSSRPRRHRREEAVVTAPRPRSPPRRLRRHRSATRLASPSRSPTASPHPHPPDRPARCRPAAAGRQQR